MQKVIIVTSRNISPEEEVNERIERLGEGWRVVSAVTQLCTHGTFEEACSGPGFKVSMGDPMHVLYVTTLVVEKS